MSEARSSLGVEILPKGTLDLVMMRDLAALDEGLREADLATTATPAVVPGAKDGGLTAAISLAGIALSAVSTLVTVLSYWSSQRPQYTVTLSSDSATHVISGLDKQGTLEVLGDLKEDKTPGRIIVRVENP